MKVAIEVNGEVIWYRDSETLEGMASLGYLKDGTQQKIIAALEEALFQAKGQLQISDTSDAPPAQTISASKSISVNVQFYDQTSGGQHSFEAQAMQEGNVVTVDAFLNDLDRGGPMTSGIKDRFGLSVKANGAY